MIRIFADHRIDYHPISGQTFLDDPWWQRRTLDSLLFTSFTSPLLAFDHSHEVLSRFDIKLFSRLVADQRSLFATLAANALLWGTSNDLFSPGQIARQFLTTRMFARCFER